MSTTMPVVPAANTRHSDQPKGYAAVQTAPNVFTVYNDDDLFSAAIPAVLGTNLFEGPITLDSRFIGIHAKAADAGYYPGGWNRGHDQAPRWNQMHLGPGVYVDAGMRAWLDSCLAAGQEPMWPLFGTPTWLSARPAEGGDPYGVPGGIAEPSDMSQLFAFAVWLATNYPQIKWFEMWNEWKGQVGGGSYGSMAAAKLAEMTRVFKQGLLSVLPGAKLAGWGCTGVLFNGAGSGITYTNQLLSASDGAGGFGRDWIDIISVHTYAHDGANDITQLANTKAWIDAIKTTNGVSSKPVWSTEFSYITPDFSVYTGPESSRANMLFRYCLWNVVGGMVRICHYPLGWSPTSERSQLWNNIARTLNGAVIQRINRVAGTPQLACIINGQRYLV